MRFCRVLLGNGQLDGARIIGHKPVELVTRSHLAGHRTIAGAAVSGEAIPHVAGSGYGLGFAVLGDTADGQVSGTPGEDSWSGAAGTCFWIDPVEKLAVAFMTNCIIWPPAPRTTKARELRAIVYGALE